MLAYSFTQEQLDLLNDFEIGREVYNKLTDGKNNDKVMLCNGKYHLHKSFFAPCSRWDDIMPIAEEYGLMVVPLECFAGLEVSESAFKYGSYNKNPLRAVCEAFLMMEI